MPQKLTESKAQEILLEFLEGELQPDGTRTTVSLDSLYKKHDVARATLYRRAEKEDWQKQRLNFVSRAREQIKQNRSDELVAEAGKLDKASLRISQAFLGRVANKLMQDQANEEAGAETLSPEHLRALSAAAMNAQKIGKLALGEASEIRQVNADVTTPDSFKRALEYLRGAREQRAEGFSPTIQ
jgi:hypothetical protein|tara:strand:+ start:16917 stop:17471 length:555 start_codon:yes stop_codon:yes gene_type:complete